MPSPFLTNKQSDRKITGSQNFATRKILLSNTQKFADYPTITPIIANEEGASVHTQAPAIRLN